MPTVGTFKKSYPIVKKPKRICPNKKSGKQHRKYSSDYIFYMKRVFYIEISKAPMFSFLMTSVNWEIWMYQKSAMRKIWWPEHRLEHHTMQVHKFGEISLTTPNVTYGLLDVWFTNFAAFNHLSKALIWISSLNQFKEENIEKFLTFTLLSCHHLLRLVSRLIQKSDYQRNSWSIVSII